jgi:hypothetical protein
MEIRCPKPCPWTVGRSTLSSAGQTAAYFGRIWHPNTALILPIACRTRTPWYSNFSRTPGYRTLLDTVQPASDRIRFGWQDTEWGRSQSSANLLNVERKMDGTRTVKSFLLFLQNRNSALPLIRRQSTRTLPPTNVV